MLKHWFTLSLFNSRYSFLCYTDCGVGHCERYCFFCDQFYHGPSMDCLAMLLDIKCISEFNTSMALLNSSDHCEWRNVNG